ncbi:MAG: hypothetical protein J2O46_02550 [Nocardioides sp.]|nr:hypothetical protein [Nocardioides sp.]
MAVLLAALIGVLSVLGLAGPASASTHGIDIPIPFDPTGGLSGVSNACNNLDAPMPASPYGDGSFIVRMSILGAAQQAGEKVNPDTGKSASTAAKPGAVDPQKDPFRNKDNVSIESVYGTTPQWWTYDNGCTGQFVAGAGTALGNILLEISGILPNWSHALLNAVIGPNSFFHALDTPIRSASAAVTKGVWAPWVSVVLLLVAGTVMLRARDGRFARAVTAAGWALGVLIVTSWLIQYPVESTKLVDQGVRSATGMIATGFNNGKSVPAQSDQAFAGASAVRAVDGQMDDVVRNTQYRTWLAGAFGDADSHSAHTYGASLFRATHFSWSEYDTYRKDPNGKGKQILQAKQDSFKSIAAKVKKDDPVAYDYFKGEHWSQRATTALVNLLVVVVTCGFLLVAGLAILLSFALIRLLVPFAPAAGVLFMLDHTRDAAVSLLKRVVGPLVMGPVYFLVALLLLRFDSSILTANMWFVVKLALIGVLTVVAWQLTRPAAYGLRIPGLSRVTSMLTSYVGARSGTEAGIREANEERAAPPPAGVANAETVPASPGGVFRQQGAGIGASPAAPAPTTYNAYQVPNPPAEGLPELGSGRQIDQRQPVAALNGRKAEEVSGAWFDTRSGSSADELYVPRQDPVRGEIVSGAPASYASPSAYDPHDSYDRPVSSAEPAYRTAPPVAEANREVDADGNEVFVIYSPSGNRAVPIDGWGPEPGGAY